MCSIDSGLSDRELLSRSLQAYHEQKIMVAGRYLQQLEARDDPLYTIIPLKGPSRPLRALCGPCRAFGALWALRALLALSAKTTNINIWFSGWSSRKTLVTVDSYFVHIW